MKAQHRMLIQLPRELHDRLVIAAEENERTIAAETRYAIKKHLEACGLPERKEEE